MPDEREDKPAWRLVPPRLKAAVDEVIGSPVVRGVRVYGGYGPSATYALNHANGSRTFFKGTYPLPDSSGVRWALDREDVVYRRLGRYIRPWAPQYLGSVRADGWHGVLLEWVDGTPALPWTPGKAMTAARSFAAFHASTLGRPLPQWLSRTQHLDFSSYWGQLDDDDGAIGRLAALAGARSTAAVEWLGSNLEALQQAERALSRAPAPFALLHFDTRSDNVRLETEMLRIFDWPFACVGPVEFDVAAFAQSIEAEGGPNPESVVGWYEEVLPIRHKVLIASVAGLSGYFADRAPLPHVAELPRLRTAQRRKLKASLAWAARLLDLPEPSWLSSVPS